MTSKTVTFPTSLRAKNRSIEIPKSLEQLSETELQRKRCINIIMTDVLKHLTTKFVEKGFEWMLPVIFSQSTDPLWPDPGASIKKRIEVEIYGTTVRTTLSMIIHKMVACSLVNPKLFILSPNVRIEKNERSKSGIHAYEFTQFDFEVRNAAFQDIKSLVEEVLCGLIKKLKKEREKELLYLSRLNSLNVPRNSFRVFDREDLEEEYGKGWENQLIFEINEPVWVINIPREFYDYEDFGTNTWYNYDLFLPEYGEVLSGARREYEYSKIIKKMERDNIRKENYKVLLALAKEGKITPSAGAGIGVERLVSWIVEAKHIGETQTFPKIPGKVYEL